MGLALRPWSPSVCAMARQCHLNTCPTGVATQRPDLRAKFKGTPDQVVTFFSFIAQQVREILASLGVHSLDQIIGRADLLERIECPDIPRAQMLDLSMLMTPAIPAPGTAVKRTVDRNNRPGVICLDDEILEECGSHIEQGLPFSGFYDIRNHHLAVGGRGGGGHRHKACRRRIAGRPPAAPLSGQRRPELRRLCRARHASRSGGRGQRLCRQGPLGAAKSASAHFARPPTSRQPKTTPSSATPVFMVPPEAGFSCSQAASRFAVRNSGATAVIEGAGNHCCEYMTEG